MSAADPGKTWVEERTGTKLPLDTLFLDEQGNQIRLGSLIDRPTILLPIYFYCPNSCSTNLANLALAISRMKLVPGKDYRAIALSFNDDDSPKDARSAKENYLKLLNGHFPADQWRFITGGKTSIHAVLDAIGYTVKPMPDGTFIHPSALVAIAADGTVIKYVYGDFISGDVELALTEASRGFPARSIKRLLNYCFNYDPDTNKSFFQSVKLVVLSAFGVFILVFFILFLRKKRDKQ